MALDEKIRGIGGKVRGKEKRAKGGKGGQQGRRLDPRRQVDNGRFVSWKARRVIFSIGCSCFTTLC